MVFYLFAAMFVGDVVTRFIIRLKSPIQNRKPYLLFAVSIALLAAIFLALSNISVAFLILAFLIAGIPDGISWTLGLQLKVSPFRAGMKSLNTNKDDLILWLGQPDFKSQFR